MHTPHPTLKDLSYTPEDMISMFMQRTKVLHMVAEETQTMDPPKREDAAAYFFDAERFYRRMIIMAHAFDALMTDFQTLNEEIGNWCLRQSAIQRVIDEAGEV